VAVVVPGIGTVMRIEGTGESGAPEAGTLTPMQRRQSWRRWPRPGCRYTGSARSWRWGRAWVYDVCDMGGGDRGV
jgi:hypothetical protein